MKHKKLWSMALAGILLLSGETAFVPYAVQAAPLNQSSGWDDTLDVTGTLNTPDGPREINRVYLDLNRSGRATIRAYGISTYTFNGTWTRDGKVAQIVFESAFGRPVSGKGVARFDEAGNRLIFKQLIFAIDARIDNRTKTFGGSFRPRTSGGDGSIRELNSTERGTGKVNIDREDDDNRLTSAQVNLKRDGRAEVTFLGQQRWLFTGTWKEANASRVNLSIQGLSSGPRSSANAGSLGDGHITITGRTFSFITLSGRIGRDKFSAQFNAGSSGGGSDNGASGTYQADGQVKRNGLKDDPISRAIIRLDSNKQAEVELVGRRQRYRFRGTWSLGFTRDYRVTLYNLADSGEKVTGEIGTKGLSATKVDDLKLNGTYDRRSFQTSLKLRE